MQSKDKQKQGKNPKTRNLDLKNLLRESTTDSQGEKATWPLVQIKGALVEGLRRESFSLCTHRIKNGVIHRILLHITSIIKETVCVYMHTHTYTHMYTLVINYMVFIWFSYSPYKSTKGFVMYLFFWNPLISPLTALPKSHQFIQFYILKQHAQKKHGRLSEIELDWKNVRMHMKGKNTDLRSGITGKVGRSIWIPGNFRSLQSLDPGFIHPPLFYNAIQGTKEFL